MQTQKERGFTLVELVVVLAVLGIVAAVAVPKYVSHVKEARVAALNGLAGAIRSAVLLVHSKYMAAATGTSPVTLLDTTTVAVTTGASGGMPLAATGGIDHALKFDGFAYTDNADQTAAFDFETPVTNCKLTYTEATGLVTLTSSGC